MNNIQNPSEFFDNSYKEDVLLFTIYNGDKESKIYLSGRMEGFPEGSSGWNHAAPFLNLFNSVWEKYVQSIRGSTKSCDMG